MWLSSSVKFSLQRHQSLHGKELFSHLTCVCLETYTVACTLILELFAPIFLTGIFSSIGENRGNIV